MRTLILLLLIAAVLSPAVASATDVEGDVWGTWTRENSPYNVVGEIRVPPGSTLVIEPGILVDFKGHYKFIVDSLATVLAIGTETDSIFFTCDTLANPDRWHGIRFFHADSSSRVSYCRLQYGKAVGSTQSDSSGGAIYCHYSSPTISFNTISDNLSYLGGGAIYCLESAATISNNTIKGNISTLARGGGIHCKSSNATISHNNIVGNSALGSGGGISCYYSSPTIAYNKVESNSTSISGGGVNCQETASAVITGNFIGHNTAGWNGGGIRSLGCSTLEITSNIIEHNTAGLGGGISFFYSSWSTVNHNRIIANSAQYSGGGINYRSWSTSNTSNNIVAGNASGSRGGGIYCDYEGSFLRVLNSTITGNRAEQSAGGIYCGHAVVIRSTILWGDEAPNHPEIDFWNGFPEVTYCDVQGGYYGQGNIDCDPLFRDPENRDFQITWENYPNPDTTKSCCIDAGSPYSPLDPDSTMADIGALYFHQYDVAEIACECLTPILCRGKNLYFKVTVTNNAQVAISGTLSFRAYADFDCEWGNILITVPRTRSYDPGETTTYYFFKIPNLVPPGEYSISVGGVLGGSDLFCCMNSTIVQCVPWKMGNNTEWQLAEVGPEEVFLPTAVSIEQNYPNPFNATTRINYQLPVDSWVKLEVYNLLGEKVATLVEEKQEAGYRSVIWEASELSSGLYFYKLTAGDFTETKRMMLVK